MVKDKTPVHAPCLCPSLHAAGAGGMQYLVKRVTKDGHLNFVTVCLAKAISHIINRKH